MSKARRGRKQGKPATAAAKAADASSKATAKPRGKAGAQAVNQSAVAASDARPPWWDELLARVDALPGATAPHDLARLLTERSEALWRESGALDGITFALHAALRPEQGMEPLRAVDLVLARWSSFHDELAARGPCEFRARVSDLLWIGRRRHDEAVRAVDAYIEAAHACARDKRSPNAGHYIQRALRISAQLKRSDLNDRARQVGLALMRDARTDDFTRWVLAQAFAEDGDETSREVADMLETLVAEALNAAPACDWDWLRSATNVAADARKAAGDTEAADRLRVAAAELHVRQAEALEKAGASAVIVADCYSRGARSLRDRGQRDAAEAAHRALLATQARIPAELAHYSSGSIDLTKEALHAIGQVKGKPFREQLLVLCDLVPKGSVARFREFAEASVKQHLFHSLVAFQALDAQGRHVRSAGNALERTMLEHAGMQRACVVMGTIEPVRRQIAIESPGSTSDWIGVMQDRVLTEPDRIVGLAKGLSAGLAGDWLVSTSVLVPQLEFLIRKLLGEADEVTSTLNADGTQREKLFSELLKKPKLAAILGEDWVFDLTSLLVEPGSNLRNRVAHGMVPDSRFNTVESPYLWFLVIELLMKIQVTRTPIETQTR